MIMDYEFEHTMNKSLEEIKEAYNKLLDAETEVREMMRNRASWILRNTNEDNKMEVEIEVEPLGSVGLSSAYLPCVTRAWQTDGEGWITFEFEYGGDTDFDYIPTNELIQILKGLEDYA
jgi:hypothetical protein